MKIKTSPEGTTKVPVGIWALIGVTCLSVVTTILWPWGAATIFSIILGISLIVASLMWMSNPSQHRLVDPSLFMTRFTVEALSTIVQILNRHGVEAISVKEIQIVFGVDPSASHTIEILIDVDHDPIKPYCLRCILMEKPTIRPVGFKWVVTSITGSIPADSKDPWQLVRVGDHLIRSAGEFPYTKEDVLVSPVGS
ncbi:hypothetical protein HGA91_02510 [candidate division WWE3 bacterium]|nr:hypothetical protein [candidate division WWE3 bacterium]